MKKFVLLIVTAIIVLTDAMAFDVKLLANNKEAFTRELNIQDEADAQIWGRQHPLGSVLKLKALKALSETFNEMEKIDTNCELGLISRLQQDAKKNGVISTDLEILDLIAYLRHENLIDDILYKLLRDSTMVSVDFSKSATARLPARPYNIYTAKNAKIDLQKFYSPVKTWPDDVKNCTLDTYYEMTQELKFKTAADRDVQMAKLNYKAYLHKVIDFQTYNKLESLKYRKVLDWPVFFKRYADVINNAKDKLTKTPEARTESNFTVEYVSRKEGLTQRTNLYRSFSSTQVMILAQIMEKTAKRMDARRASLNWQYTDDATGEIEIYVLSPMEQYRAAIRMLKKDMAEVMRSEAFRGIPLEYEHLIAAAYETGFIKSEELSYVLKFEDFWNPKTPKWQAYANFAFSIAGTATFYLPPPWNIIGSIGLVLAQSRLVNRDQKPDPDDNWNVII